MWRFLLGLEELYVAIPWLGGAVCRDSLAWRNPGEPRGGQEDARNGPEEARRGQKRPRKRLERAHGCQESRGKASRAQARASQICVSAGVLEMHHYLSSDSPSIEQGSAAGAQPDGFESPGPGAPHRSDREKRGKRRDDKHAQEMVAKLAAPVKHLQLVLHRVRQISSHFPGRDSVPQVRLEFSGARKPTTPRGAHTLTRFASRSRSLCSDSLAWRS